MKKYLILYLALMMTTAYAEEGKVVSIQYNLVFQDYLRFSRDENNCFYEDGEKGSRPERFLRVYEGKGSISQYVKRKRLSVRCVLAKGYYSYKIIDREGYAAKVKISCGGSEGCWWVLESSPSASASYTLERKGAKLIINQRRISG